ncbi:hypothetical protein HQ560_15235 [bacterium]|nr:hypothetical protein [bacterium]
MAIDPVQKVWLVSPAAEAQDIPGKLGEIGLLHVSEVPVDPAADAAPLSRLTADTRVLDARIRNLTEINETLSEFNKAVRDLLSNLIPTPIETTQAELDAALEAVDAGTLHEQVKTLSARRQQAEAEIEKARDKLTTVADFRNIKVTVPAASALRYTWAALWLVSAKQAARLVGSPAIPQDCTLETLGEIGGKTLIATICLAEDGDGVAAQLRSIGFEQVAAPEQSTALAGYIEGIEADLQAATEARDAAVAELKTLSELRPQVELALGHAEEERGTALALGQMVATGRAVVLQGFVRTREIDSFKSAVELQLPQVSMVVEEPSADDNVPVSLSNSKFFSPAQFLVEMFGMPGYFQFDPTIYLMFSFVIFFGVCLGDAVYGIAMYFMMVPLAKKYRNYPGLRNFFTLLSYCAVTSFIVGVLTGTWAADLLKYFGGEGNFLYRAANSVKIMDMLDKPLVALALALGMGILNQFWGICMNMHGHLRRGDKWSALCDGGFWFAMLPGLVLLLAWYFSSDKPAWMINTGLALAGVGGLGLVLTQGRNEETTLGKVVVGVVSLYGIVGSYGAVTFIGATLSYSRLLALGLTTAIVGMAVNIIAGMVGSVPVIGIVLFTVIVAGGHIFNLLISGLGAFIHAARLIFVEFFGRFYDPGAERFAPLGAVAGRIRVMD